jgi:hypothetical protein
MTEYQNATTPMPAVVTAPAGAEQSSGEQASMSDRASEAANQGKQAVSDVTSTAADKARQVTEETARQARDLHRNLVSGLRSLSDELGSMRADQPGLASELVSQAHERVNGAADWFERRQPGDLVGEIRDFARRRPGTFLLGAALAGIAVGRLTRGAVAAHSDDSDSASAHQVSDATTATPTAPSAGFGEPTDGLYGVGATPTTSYNASTEPAPEFGTPQQSAPGYGAPTYPATGGGYGGPQ